eukprot:Clim_evm6s251 gene=Clim_evmTU6s251
MGFVTGFATAIVLVIAAYFGHPGPVEIHKSTVPEPVFTTIETVKPALQNVLSSAEKLHRDVIVAAETIIPNPASQSLYCFCEDGYIREVMDQGRGEVKTVAYVKGRPLGGALDIDGTLLIAEPDKGLVRLDPKTGVITVLSNKVENSEQPSINYANDVDVCPDGSIFFSDSVYLHPTRNMKGKVDTLTVALFTFISSDESGRLLRYDRETGKTYEVTTGLWYANGVACDYTSTKDKTEYVLINETFTSRIWRVNVKTGKREIFAEGFPGVLDGLSRGSNHTYWVGLPSKISPFRHVRNIPWLRGLISKLPTFLRPGVVPVGMIAQLDAKGNILRVLGDTAGKDIFVVSAVTEMSGKLYLGSLVMPYLAVYTL